MALYRSVKHPFSCGKSIITRVLLEPVLVHRIVGGTRSRSRWRTRSPPKTKGSDQQKQLDKVLKFLGKPGKANYVSIESGSLAPGEREKADTSTSTDMLGNRDTITLITLDLNQSGHHSQAEPPPLWGAEPHDDAGVIGHEGTHGVDQFPLGTTRRREPKSVGNVTFDTTGLHLSKNEAAALGNGPTPELTAGFHERGRRKRGMPIQQTLRAGWAL